MFSRSRLCSVSRETIENISPIDYKSPFHFLFGFLLGWILSLLSWSLILGLIFIIPLEFGFHRIVCGFSIIGFERNVPIKARLNAIFDITLAYLGFIIWYFI
jgi:hypothetical protein